jgi:colicin import membrane protein/SWI/SNF-related matrix-associated actin-dependent regulator 1 of chromatin subfamily A
VLDEKSELGLAPTEMVKAPAVDAPGAGIRAWAAVTSAASRQPKARDETAVAGSSSDEASSPAPFKPTGAATSAGKLRAWAGLGSADRTEIPDSSAPVSLPFDRSRRADPPAPAKPASTRSRGETVIGAKKSADRTIPFATDRDREEALAKKREADERLEAERRAEAARKADEPERAREEKAAEEKREAERRAFEAEQARLARVEAERKELAAQQARADARKVEDALYGGLRKKPKKGA